MSLLLHFLCNKMSFLIISDAIQNAILADEAFYDSTDGGAVRNIMSRKGKFISRICLCSSEDESCSLNDGRVSV